MHSVPDFSLQNIVEFICQLISYQKPHILVFHDRIEKLKILPALGNQNSINIPFVVIHGRMAKCMGLERLMVSDLAERTSLGGAVVAHAEQTA